MVQKAVAVENDRCNTFFQSAFGVHPGTGIGYFISVILNIDKNRGISEIFKFLSIYEPEPLQRINGIAVDIYRGYRIPSQFTSYNILQALFAFFGKVLFLYPDRRAVSVFRRVLHFKRDKDAFISECEYDYELGISLITSAGLVKILDGYKNSHMKEFPARLLMKDGLLNEDRIVKVLGG